MGHGHARLGPSNHRWPHCPGSVREETRYEDTSGPAALDGTGSHLLLELCLQDGAMHRAEVFLHRTIGEGHPEIPQGWYVDTDRVERVQMALDYITRRMEELDVQWIRSEVLSNPGEHFGRTDWWGTTDIVIHGVCRNTRCNVLEVIDYKDGRGFVDAKNNSQLTSYAMGQIAPLIFNQATRKHNPHNGSYLVRMTIVQPRSTVPVRYEEVSAPELWDRGKVLAQAAKATDDPNAPLIPGKHCQWCKHKGACVEYTGQALEGAALMTIATDGKSSLIEAIKTGAIAPTEMDSARIAAILDASALITKMIEAVEAEAMRRLEAGDTVPGYEIGTGRNSREWIDEEEVVAKKLKGMRFLKDEIYPTKLVSPAQACKKTGLSDRQVKALESLIKVVPGKPKVVKTKDSPAAVTTVEQMFGNVKDPETIEAPKTLSFL